MNPIAVEGHNITVAVLARVDSVVCDAAGAVDFINIVLLVKDGTKLQIQGRQLELLLQVLQGRAVNVAAASTVVCLHRSAFAVINVGADSFDISLLRRFLCCLAVEAVEADAAAASCG